MWWIWLKMLLFECAQVVSMAIQFKSVFRLRLLQKSGREEEALEMVGMIAGIFFRGIFRKLNCPVLVEGREHIPLEQPFVLMVNHQSKYDIPLLGGFLGKPLGFVAKKELFRIPILSFWMREIGCIPLDRKDISGGVSTISRLGSRMKEENRGFIIFPEGTRTRDPDGAIQGFRQGSLRLAVENGIPVLPVTIDGTRLLDCTESLWKSRAGGRYVRIRIEPPRALEENNAPARRRFMENLREVIVSNHKAIHVKWPGY